VEQVLLVAEVGPMQQEVADREATYLLLELQAGLTLVIQQELLTEVKPEGLRDLTELQARKETPFQVTQILYMLQLAQEMDQLVDITRFISYSRWGVETLQPKSCKRDIF
jgi:hypothetical protein